MRASLFTTIVGAGFAALSTSALADETWQTAYGEVAWMDHNGGTAILHLEDSSFGRHVRMYVPGLQDDMMGGRGSYHGIWVGDSGDADCQMQMVGPDGFGSNYWGQFVITFVRDAFPSDWAGVVGNCLDVPMSPISGIAP